MEGLWAAAYFSEASLGRCNQDVSLMRSLPHSDIHYLSKSLAFVRHFDKVLASHLARFVSDFVEKENAAEVWYQLLDGNVFYLQV